MSFSEFNLSILECHRLRFANGDKTALLDAIKHCAAYKTVMPPWVAGSYISSIDKWSSAEVKTLDKAFQVERKKHYSISKDRRLIRNSFDVYLAFVDAEHQGRALDDELAEEIAKRFDTNRNAVWEMYNEIRKNNPIGRGLESTRKR